MIIPAALVSVMLVELLEACIPTQNVDPVTTTAVPTTTVTEPPFPCNVCQKVYSPACQGFGIPDLLTWCPTAAEAGIEYLLGAVNALFPFVPPGSCSTVVVCPPTTTLRYRLFGSNIPGPSPAIAWCEESGPVAGKWFTGISWIARFELASLDCMPII